MTTSKVKKKAATKKATTTTTDLARPADSALVIPDWMQSEAIVGVEQVGEHMTTPRLVIVQAMSEEERKEAFGEGGVAIMPDGVKIADKGEEFVAIPLVFWPSWEIWSDINDATAPMIEDSTQDPNSDIARRARTKDAREEMYGDGFKRRFVESLNFIVLIDSGPAVGEVASLSFNVGEHYTGSKLCGMLKRRPCSIFANRIAFKTASRKRNNRSWYGFDFNNPETDPIIQDKEQYDKLASMHADLTRLVSQVVVTREDVVQDADDIPV